MVGSPTDWLFPITWTCWCGFQGDWTNAPAAYYDWLLSAITSIRWTGFWQQGQTVFSQEQIPWVKGQHIQFPAVRVTEAYDSTSATQQCQEPITNVPTYTHSFLAYSSLHILNVSSSCSFTVSSPAALTTFINPYFFSLISHIFYFHVSVREICSATMNSLVILWVFVCVYAV